MNYWLWIGNYSLPFLYSRHERSTIDTSFSYLRFTSIPPWLVQSQENSKFSFQLDASKSLRQHMRTGNTESCRLILCNSVNFDIIAGIPSSILLFSQSQWNMIPCNNILSNTWWFRSTLEPIRMEINWDCEAHSACPRSLFSLCSDLQMLLHSNILILKMYWVIFSLVPLLPLHWTDCTLTFLRN